MPDENKLAVTQIGATVVVVAAVLGFAGMLIANGAPVEPTQDRVEWTKIQDALDDIAQNTGSAKLLTAIEKGFESVNTSLEDLPAEIVKSEESILKNQERITQALTDLTDTWKNVGNDLKATTDAFRTHVERFNKLGERFDSTAMAMSKTANRLGAVASALDVHIRDAANAQKELAGQVGKLGENVKSEVGMLRENVKSLGEKLEKNTSRLSQRMKPRVRVHFICRDRKTPITKVVIVHPDMKQGEIATIQKAPNVPKQNMIYTGKLGYADVLRSWHGFLVVGFDENNEMKGDLIAVDEQTPNTLTVVCDRKRFTVHVSR